MDFAKAKIEILAWVENFVEVANPALSGWPPCPYARKTRLSNKLDIREGTEPSIDLEQCSKDGIGKFDVIIYVYDRSSQDHDKFSAELEHANKQWLIPNDIIVLEDHPSDPEIVNGCSMNQGTYVMAMVQSLSDLNKRAKDVAKKGFYDAWPEEYLKVLFQHREDPRQS
jgi:hypothetical protein